MDSTSTLDEITTAQAQKEVTANEGFRSASPAMAFARRGAAASGLNFQLYGVARWYIDATATSKINTNVALTASTIRYVSVDRSLNFVQVATTWDPDKLALYRVDAGASAVNSWQDHRDPHHINRFLYGRFTLAMGDANKTLTYEQAMCESMELTGALTALRDVIVPTIKRSYIVFANTTGAFGVRVKTSAGSGITVADGKRAILECDGTNVVRVTADV